MENTSITDKQPPESSSDQAVAEAFENAMHQGPNPQIVVLTQGRSMFEVKGGKAFIKVSLEDKAHWGEAIAHEMGHWMLHHVQPQKPEEMYRQELEAWEWAMQKGLKFDRQFVEDCIFTHALEMGAPEIVVNAMIRGDALVNQYKANWKPA